MQDNFKQLVLGLVFSKDLKKILLIHKNRPPKFLGKVNGIGGKLKVDERRTAGMVREFLEETGIETRSSDWIVLGKIVEKAQTIYLFTYRYLGKPNAVKTITDEKIEWFSINKLPQTIMNNIPWLILLALDKLKNDEIEYITLKNNF